MTIPFSELRKQWRNNPEVMQEYGSLGEEFDLARKVTPKRLV